MKKGGSFLPKWYKQNKTRNKEIKSENGNGKKSINIVHWNLGSRFRENKVDYIQLLEDEFNPCIAFISESNYWEGLDSSESNI